MWVGASKSIRYIHNRPTPAAQHEFSLVIWYKFRIALAANVRIAATRITAPISPSISSPISVMAKSSPAALASLCPCGNPGFAQCCGPLLAGEMPAPTAERLMRSRYSAYSMGNEAYLQATWHSSTRPAKNIIDQEEKLQWLGLEVKSAPALRIRKRQVELTEQSSSTPQSNGAATVEIVDTRSWATVEFVARYKIAGRAHRLHEISRFVCEIEDGVPHWYYVDGSFPER